MTTPTPSRRSQQKEPPMLQILFDAIEGAPYDRGYSTTTHIIRDRLKNRPPWYIYEISGKPCPARVTGCVIRQTPAQGGGCRARYGCRRSLAGMQRVVGLVTPALHVVIVDATGGSCKASPQVSCRKVGVRAVQGGATCRNLTRCCTASSPAGPIGSIRGSVRPVGARAQT